MQVKQPPVKFISQEELIEKVASINNRFFSVRFIKRSNRAQRYMLCMKNVTKHLTGGSLKFDPKNKGLIGVFDLIVHEYRFIPTEGLYELTYDGIRYSSFFSPPI